MPVNTAMSQKMTENACDFTMDLLIIENRIDNIVAKVFLNVRIRVFRIFEAKQIAKESRSLSRL